MTVFFDAITYNFLDQVNGEGFVDRKPDRPLAGFVTGEFTFEDLHGALLRVEPDMLRGGCKPDEDSVEKERRHPITDPLFGFRSNLPDETLDLHELLSGALGSGFDVFIDRRETRF